VTFKKIIHGWVWMLTVGCAAGAYAQVDVHVLETEELRVELTADIGGRVLAVYLEGHENFLKVGEAVNTHPNPEVSEKTGFIPYFGHESWVGPQSAWWTGQDVNEVRQQQKATWPPDPYLVVAPNTVVEKSAMQMVMQTPESPISGVELRKTFALDETAKNRVNLKLEGTNIRTEAVSWDLWFNTRVHADTQVYVPVLTEGDVRVTNFIDAQADGLDYSINDGILSLNLTPPAETKTWRHGKLFIQPSEGWLAGFRNGQVFIIRFPVQPLKHIHPEQGQVELYHDYRPHALSQGMLEMEVHGIYRTLAPGETMSATEQWTLLAYDGPDTHEARIAFLRDNLPQIERIE
jgi:hypothetical protein